MRNPQMNKLLRLLINDNKSSLVLFVAKVLNGIMPSRTWLYQCVTLGRRDTYGKEASR